MKFGFFADVHGNLEALTCVLDTLREVGCVRLYCLGDVVGYGPEPNACVDALREAGIECVRGNHDDWCAKNQIPIGARPEIRYTLAWTREQLSEENLQWLGELPSQIDVAGMSLVHACHGADGIWPYVRDERTLRFNFLHQTRRIGICGHTHVPAIGLHMVGEGVCFLPIGPSVTLPDDGRILINPGSVGQPRDHDPRAACMVYETRDRTVTFLKVDYDIPATQVAMRMAGLPLQHIERLNHGN